MKNIHIFSLSVGLGVAACLLCANNVHALTFTDTIPGSHNLYHDDWGHPYNITGGGNELDALGRGEAPLSFGSGLAFAPNQSISITATGCTVDDGLLCTEPGGYDSLFRGLPVYSLIGVWSSDANTINPVEEEPNPAFFIGSTLDLITPDYPDNLYLFLATNDGIFSDNPDDFFYTVTVNDSTSVPEPSSIDTTVGWDGGGYTFCSGCYYGQILEVPTTENVLDSFTFFLSGSHSSTPVISYRAHIAPWDGNTFQSGNALYTSSTRSNEGFRPRGGADPANYTEETFTLTEGLTLIPGEQYVAYLHTDPGSGVAVIGHNYKDVYPDGYTLFGSPPSGWYSAGVTADYAFKASFSAPKSVPEPSRIVGIVALGVGIAFKCLSASILGKVSN